MVGEVGGQHLMLPLSQRGRPAPSPGTPAWTENPGLVWGMLRLEAGFGGPTALLGRASAGRPQARKVDSREWVGQESSDKSWGCLSSWF